MATQTVHVRPRDQPARLDTNGDARINTNEIPVDPKTTIAGPDTTSVAGNPASIFQAPMTVDSFLVLLNHLVLHHK